MKKVFTYSFGCRVNLAEKEKLDRELIIAGFELNTNNPDICIINTCSVTQKAEREARQLIYRLKKKHPKTKIVITGCSATLWQKNKTYLNLPIDLLVNNSNKKNLVRYLLDLRGQARPVTTRQGITFFDKFQNSKRLLVKIQDGCHRFCSYCIVPYLRGLPQSKKISDIVNQIKLAEKDSCEVILTAINTEAFGQDTNESFVDLIKNVLDKTKVKRLSFGSIHPWSINKDLLKYYSGILKSDRFIHFFHIPLQSGSNKILKLMKRDYTREEIMSKLMEIKRLNSMAQIATDIIVGFLEETDRDFQDTYDFLERSPISKFHVFRFSQRKDTAAFYMAKRLIEPTYEQKKKRSKALIELGQKKYFSFRQQHVDKNFSGLFLDEKIGDFRKCLLNNQVQAFIKTNKSLPGEIKTVKIIEVKKDSLIGRLI